MRSQKPISMTMLGYSGGFRAFGAAPRRSGQLIGGFLQMQTPKPLRASIGAIDIDACDGSNPS